MMGNGGSLMRFFLRKTMETESSVTGGYRRRFTGFLRKCMFSVLSMGPVPNHIAFIMDGNRRYAKKRNLQLGEGHRAGFASLMWILGYCYELGVKYVTIYAFSIDNFKRRPNEVQVLMDLMLEKIDELLKEESLVRQYGIQLYFIGNLKLLSDNVREAVERAMEITAKNNKLVLLICVPYTSTDEILHAVEESCQDKLDHSQAVKQTNGSTDHCNQTSQEDHEHDIKVVDIEKRMYMAAAPDLDILIRSSGETRLSNFLLYQSDKCQLYSPAALWPELGLWHFVWAVLSYQRSYSYFEKKRKQL
ncbi:dehydrodolichyl diphosphate synthase 6-like isoform X2 [Punica granatum]|uniref:Alkyl transferase n=1 Tax=Punica granatum TaxID=22663 RepID=A0A6P8DDN3_PUNGR|nr:dehydrodolichyl diphosphate synthase 6-like isoform X2 [Punica granatum]